METRMHHTNLSLNIFLSILFASFTFFSAALTDPGCASTKEITIPAESTESLALTIYNSDLALIKDTRLVNLPSGRQNLAYSGISANIKPETALLSAKGIKVIEQNFEFDLLTPEALLKKYTGRKVEIIKRHPTTGEETALPATVLSTNNGVVLKIGNRIETGIPGRIAFPDLPQDLRIHPTLCMLADVKEAGRRSMQLTYLTTGLSWHADYVVELADTETSLNIKGWVTLTNTSGTSYKNAQLKLVAGDVNRVRGNTMRRAPMLYKAAMVERDIPENMQEEGLMDYHLYTLGHKTTIKNRQTKQVSLLRADSVPCKKEYVVQGQRGIFTRRNSSGATRVKVGIFLSTSNTKEKHLGIPMPKGTVRVYKADSKGNLQFVGEDRIDHTPENEEIRLRLGDAFDITAWRKQTDFRKLSGFSGYNYVYEAAFEIKIKNALEKKVEVNVRENLPGDWTIKSESIKHSKLAAHLAQWKVKVPAKGSTTLKYRAIVKY